MRTKLGFIIAVCLVTYLPLHGAENPKPPLERFEEMRKSFEEHLQDAKSAQSDFDGRYETELEKLQSASMKKGELDLVLAIREERAGFRAGGERALSDHAELAKLQGVYAKHRAKIQAEQNKAVHQLLKGYVERLGQLRNELTKAGEIDLAVQVQEESRRAEGLISAMPAEKGASLPPREAPEPVKGITVLQAFYGSAEQFENDTAHDVTEKAKQHIVDGKLLIENMREAFGDPHPYRTKLFKMTYLRDGKTKGTNGTGKRYEFEDKGATKLELNR